MSAAPFVSPSPSNNGLPTSNVSHFAITFFFSLSKSAIFLIVYDLCHGAVFFQISKPFSADFRAFCTSNDEAFDALPIISSVAGLTTS